MKIACLIAVIGWSLCVAAAWFSAVRMTDAMTARVLAAEAEVSGQTKRIEELTEALRLVQVYAEGTRSVVESRVMGK